MVAEEAVDTVRKMAVAAAIAVVREGRVALMVALEPGGDDGRGRSMRSMRL